MALQEIHEKFGGSWKMARSEKFEEYLEAMGVGIIKRTVASKLSPVLEISVEGDVVKVITKTTIKTLPVEGKLGEEFDTETLGRHEKTVYKFEDGKLIATSVPIDSKQKVSVIERDIVDGELVQTMTVGDVVCKRYFCRNQ
ncbi:fatty acid-binding protein, liver-like [Gigantopelta aegis]|uniref:fatty acid-binding protein, liver-like n=1 Tax=Gigantopelta aegis TaxID=1735272 RepID=UPI001B88E2AA|nr:fatty acid-binding protein, liver-like [Gigantopelta aegis]